MSTIGRVFLGIVFVVSAGNATSIGHVLGTSESSVLGSCVLDWSAEATTSITWRYEVAAQECASEGSPPRFTILATRFELGETGVLVLPDARHADPLVGRVQCAGGTDLMWMGLAGQDAPTLEIRANEIRLHGSIVLGNGGSGQSVTAYVSESDCHDHDVEVVAGNGGKSSTLSLVAGAITDQAKRVGGIGGKGGDATIVPARVHEASNPQSNETEVRGANGTALIDPDGEDATAEGRQGQLAYPVGHTGYSATARAGHGAVGALVGGNGGHALAVSGEGGQTLDSTDPALDGGRGGHGGSVNSFGGNGGIGAGAGGDGGDAVGRGGNGANGGDWVSANGTTYQHRGGRGGHGGGGGTVHAVGGIGGAGNESGRGGFANATGGRGGNGGDSESAQGVAGSGSPGGAAYAIGGEGGQVLVIPGFPGFGFQGGAGGSAVAISGGGGDGGNATTRPGRSGGLSSSEARGGDGGSGVNGGPGGAAAAGQGPSGISGYLIEAPLGSTPSTSNASIPAGSRGLPIPALAIAAFALVLTTKRRLHQTARSSRGCGERRSAG